MSEEVPGGAPGEKAFEARRRQARQNLDQITGAVGGDHTDRRHWFEQVYSLAEGDAAGVPWADLCAKKSLTDWLVDHPGNGSSAIDIACGLGDNAEALSAANWNTTAFDFAEEAVQWARKRFPDSQVDYQVADLLDLPEIWYQAFDLVHECYTIQALQSPMREQVFKAVANLVKPGGLLLVITRSRLDDEVVQGPPWPLSQSELATFEAFGLQLVDRLDYKVSKGERDIPHIRMVFTRPIS